MRSPSTKLAGVLASFLSLSPCSVAADPRSDAVLEVVGASARRCEKVEFAIRIDGSWKNPFDPDEIDVRLRITAPSGAEVSVPAFWCQDHERRRIEAGDTTTDWLYPCGAPGFRARFASHETGMHVARVFWKDAGAEGRSEGVRFEVGPSESRGFVRASKANPRFLETEDNRPLFLIGQNVAFVGEAQYVNLSKAEAIFRKLAECGANFARVWICCEDWATAVEARKSAWGRSWAWRPPFAALPGMGDSPRYVKIGEGTLDIDPSHPVAVRPATRYVLRGRVLVEGGARVRASTAGRDLGEPLTAERDGVWTEWSREIVTGEGQWWLGRISLRLDGGGGRDGRGTAWLDGLSLKEAEPGEASGSPELLWEAAVDRPVRGYYNPLDCATVDALVEAAEKSGIYLQLCVITRDLYMPALKDPSSAEYRKAIADARKLLRYAAARWGHSTAVAAWEYFNEMDPGLPTDGFYEEAGASLEEIDAYHHLRATSGWGPAPKDWRHPRLDLAELHHYLRPESKEGGGFRDVVAAVLERTALLRRHAPRKPLLLAEFGLAENNWQQSRYLREDSELAHFHDAIWASALSGAAGTTAFWWWDQLDRMDAYRHYRPLSAFIAGLPFNDPGLREATATVSGGVPTGTEAILAVGLATERGAWIWLHDPRATWHRRVVERVAPEEVKDAGLEVRRLTTGDYRLTWWDTRQGLPIREDSAAATAAGLRVAVPAFKGDIACRIARRGDPDILPPRPSSTSPGETRGGSR